VVDPNPIVATGACPGCGVVLPGAGEPWDRRSTASEACRALYGEALGYEHAHLVPLGRWHQLLVDTYGAQHAGEQTPAITTAFGLIGLFLALEHDRPGSDIRDVHQMLANRYHEWPHFRPPRVPATMTVQDLVRPGTPNEYTETLNRWAQSVWTAWREEHPRVQELVNARLPRPGGWTPARRLDHGPGAIRH
jgi:Family of unknown function (DUF5946)